MHDVQHEVSESEGQLGEHPGDRQRHDEEAEHADQQATATNRRIRRDLIGEMDVTATARGYSARRSADLLEGSDKISHIGSI